MVSRRERLTIPETIEVTLNHQIIIARGHYDLAKRNQDPLAEEYQVER